MTTLHVTNGDHAADRLRDAGIAGDVLAWRDVLYDERRSPGWPGEPELADRAAHLSSATGGGLPAETVLAGLRTQYQALADAVTAGRPILLWFDACLFDQSMLAHLLACLAPGVTGPVELIVIDSYPGIEPYHGLGQLTPAQLAGCVDRRRAVTAEQFRFASDVDRAFASQDATALQAIAHLADAPLPWMPAAAARWLRERPDPMTGLGQLETLALAAIRGGCEVPSRLFAEVSAADTPPQFWGDTTLWARINGLADRQPPLVTISGPASRLPLWGSDPPVDAFTVTATPAFHSSREVAARPERVFAAFQDADRLARWWGPDGFTNTFHTFEFRDGGAWRFTMHGPDGRDYPNEAEFVAIVANASIRMRHVNLPHYDLTITLAPTPAGTRVTWDCVFENRAFAENARGFIETSNAQNMDRLAAEVARVHA